MSSYFVRYLAPAICPTTGKPCDKNHQTCMKLELMENGIVSYKGVCKNYQPPKAKKPVE